MRPAFVCVDELDVSERHTSAEGHIDVAAVVD
jgi:hypothetical protein